jgi:glucose-6-phosphate dehydrogenase assembly protein OpcA
MPSAGVIDPEHILRELREMWVQLGRDRQAHGGVLRACAMTLVVAAEPDSSGADAAAAHRTIGLLMHDQPSRAIVISPRAGGEFAAPVFSAHVFSECWMPFGSQQQICADGIEIASDAEQTDEVARLLVPLIAPDLPVVLWCRGARAFLDRSLDPLFPLADKIIFDTARVRHPPSAIEFLRRMRHSIHGRRQVVADLAWTRLTAWREAVGHLLEPDAARVTVARVTQSGAKPGTSALYFARWIEGAIPGVSVLLDPAAADTISDAAGLCAVTFSGAGGERSIQLAASGSLQVRAGERTYASPLPPITEETLMREELTILGRDPVFDRVLA